MRRSPGHNVDCGQSESPRGRPALQLRLSTEAKEKAHQITLSVATIERPCPRRLQLSSASFLFPLIEMRRPIFSGTRPERDDITGKREWQAAAAPIARGYALDVVGGARLSKELARRVGVISRCRFDRRTCDTHG